MTYRLAAFHKNFLGMDVISLAIAPFSLYNLSRSQKEGY